MSQDAKFYGYFAVVAEELSFTAAAARLNVAQPWLSARIRQLEARLGFALFKRTTRRVELTDQGKALLPRARAIREAIDAFEQAARALSDAPPSLRVGTPPYAGRFPVTRRIAEAFRRDYRDTQVEMDVGWSRALVARAQAGELDAVFALGLEHRAGFDEIKLAEIALELEMDADDPLAKVEALVPEDLAGRSIVVFSRAPNPHLFDLLYGKIKSAGARLIEEAGFWPVEVGREPFGRDRLLARPATGAERAPPPGRVRRRVEQIAPVSFKLLRRTGQATQIADAFWRIAKAVAEQEGG
jgi:DNA-binding transcriptional LysR family regulator